MSLLGMYYGFLAYKKHAKENYNEAKVLYEKAIENGLDKADKLSAYAWLLLRDSEYEKAIKILDKVMLMSPMGELRIRVRQNRAIAYMKLGNYDEAKVVFEDIHNSRKSKSIYQTLGYFYVLTDDERAEEYNMEAYDYDDTDAVILDNLAQLYIKKKDYEKARKYALKAYKENSFSVDILHHITLIEEYDGNTDKAIEYAQEMMDAKITGLNDITKEERQKLYDRIVNK